MSSGYESCTEFAVLQLKEILEKTVYPSNMLAETTTKIFLVSYIEERPWWPIQSSKKEVRRKRAAERIERSDQVY